MKTRLRWRFFVLIMFAMSSSIMAQPDAPGRFSANIEVQAYPAGLISVFAVSRAFGGNETLSLYAGYNLTDRQDFGEHENEEGGGPGFGIGWRHYFTPQHDSWHVGVRADFWFLDIDWQDGDGSRQGTTAITVLQPTVQAGYTWLLGSRRWLLSTTVAVGAEINVRTKGEAVGEGAILLGGVGLAYRF